MSTYSTERELVEQCVTGRPEAGVELIRRFWAQGKDVTIDTLVQAANPTMRIGVQAFDCLADALDRALRGPGAPA